MDLWVIILRNTYVLGIVYLFWESKIVPNIYFFDHEIPAVRPYLAIPKIGKIICQKKSLKKFLSNQSQTESHYSTYIWAHCDSIWGQLEQNCGCDFFFKNSLFF